MVQQQQEEDPSLGQTHVRAASRPLPRSIQNQIAQDILTHRVLQVPFTRLIPPNFSKEQQIGFPFMWTQELLQNTQI